MVDARASRPHSNGGIDGSDNANAAISGGELNTEVRDIASSAYVGFETQASQIAHQQQAVAGQHEAITRILADCPPFVAQTHTETQAAMSEMNAEVDALHTKFQDVVKFIDGVPDTVALLDARLKGITTWISGNQLDNMPARVATTEAKSTGLEATFDQRCSELTSEIAALRTSGST